MKKLLLIRHAKASHDTSYRDFERPLKQSGLEDAMMMAARLHSRSVIPQVLVSSPALRTLSTANIFSEHLSLPEPLVIKEIYNAGFKTLLRIIGGLPGKYDFVGLVGHNPAISDVLYYLTGDSVDMNPGAFAVTDLDIEHWEMASEDTGKLAWYSTPKETH